MTSVRPLRRHLPRFPWNRLDLQLDTDDVFAAIVATEGRAQAEFSEPDVRAFLLSSRPAAIRTVYISRHEARSNSKRIPIKPASLTLRLRTQPPQPRTAPDTDLITRP